ncbi:MAG: molybdopterin-dependent oxidoreductase [Planctomycetaceae bacterium]|nr:molybdopterin-dependent oxidoreductase [Planctomycetaceae bacterium]
MTSPRDEFLTDYIQLTRRHLLGLGAVGAAAWAMSPLSAAEPQRDAVLQDAVDKLETWLTPADKFRDVSRGKPIPHTLPEEKRQEVGLTRETWKLEVLSDPENPARLRKPLSVADGTALDFAGLMTLAEKHAVRFAKVMTCLNIGCPLGTGVWEGVPLREVLWLTQPRENLRRVFYHGFHNDDPAQMFRSSLPVGRVLEDPFDLPPVILCYKLNGEWLSPQRGGPVRIVVPEAYGFKSVKWLTTVVLSNLFHANDTYANGNNDVDSPLKTFAATLNAPTEVQPDTPFAVTGYAQVGISGLSKVQVWLQDDAKAADAEDRYFTDAPWVDAAILSPPAKWGGNLPDDRLPAPLHNFDAAGQPKSWPLRLTKAHWAVLLPGVPAGKYTLRCRTIDEHGHAQPKPRPFQKSGHAAIEQVAIRVG